MMPALDIASGSLSDLFSAHYSLSYSHGWTDWLGHTVASAAVHALLYSLIYRLMHHLTLAQAAVLVLAVLGVMFLLARARDHRRW